MKTVLTLVALLVLAVPAHAAELYRWIEGSTVVYSDQPPQDSVITAMPESEPLAVVTAEDTTPATAHAAPANPTATAPPESPTPSKPATVAEILDLSGVRAQLPSLAGSLGAEYLPRPGQLDARDGARVARIVGQHFAADRLYAAIHQEFGRSVDREQLNAMAAWFRSPLGRRITALEIAAAKPEAAPEIAAFAASLKKSPATAARLELVQQLDWVTGTSDDTTALALAIAGSVARAAAVATPAERRPRAGLVDRRVEEMRGQMATGIGETVLTQMLYVYSPLTDAELKAYVEFLASPQGRIYSRTSHTGLLRAVRESADRTATEIVRAVPQGWAAATQKAAGPPAR
jgi:hypothetical protein